ncbi:MAG TPA: hypothetical protein EYQ05_02785 [Gammaproteobacteria bacterium]|nr:hypothetical protein [Gammaproteobacteria bacterium]
MAYVGFGTSWPGTTAGGAANSASNNYTQLFKTAYADMIRLKAQTLHSALSDTCMPEVLRGDPLMLDSYKSVTLTTRDRGQQYGANGSDKPYKETDNERRELRPEFHEFAELFDPRDERALMRAIQPDGAYVANVAAAFNRKKDEVILNAFRGGVTVNGTELADTATVQLHGFRKDCDAAYGSTIAIAGALAPGSAADLLGGAGTGTANDASSASGDNITGTIGAACVAGLGAVNFGAAGGETGLDPSFTLTQEFGCQQIVEGDLQTIGSTGVASSAGTVGTDAAQGLHIKKLLTGLNVLQTNGAWQGQRIYVVLHPDQVNDLMHEAQYTSSDYNALQPLMYGQPVPFLGMEFRVCNQIPKETVLSGVGSFTIAEEAVSGTNDDAYATGALTTATNGRYVWMYTEDANIFGMGDEMTVRFDEIPDRGYSLQCYHDFSLGAVRMDPKKMVAIPCHKGTTAA